MTGRNLYERAATAAEKQTGSRWIDGGWARENALTRSRFYPVAWPFLRDYEQAFWNELARAITPKPRKMAPDA